MSFKHWLKTFLYGKSSIRLCIAVILSFSFSIAVTLSTVGIMDGFEELLISHLNSSVGDIKLSSSLRFIQSEELKKIYNTLNESDIGMATDFLQTEGFLMNEKSSKGVLIRGVDPTSFSQVINISFPKIIKEQDLFLGAELARELKLKPNDPVVIAFSKGNKTIEGLPFLYQGIYRGSLYHGIHEQDARLVYMHLEKLRDLIHAKGQSNVMFMKLSSHLPKTRQETRKEKQQRIKEQIVALKEKISEDYELRPYWSDFSSLIQAVEIEKTTILIILQIIVLISIFNMAAFVTFLKEKKAQEIFMLRTLGLSQKRLLYFWSLFLFFIWILSCLGSILFCIFFNWSLGYFSFLKLPSSIYVLDHLSLHLHGSDYGLVFGLSLIWVVGLMFFLKRYFRRGSILANLRKEFS
ncbi:MAG: ABC transporter permease [Bacteriovoracaceae bacterium]|nr:ABC transporter permease [Bacteriovoracaceae bacterium]